MSACLLNICNYNSKPKALLNQDQFLFSVEWIKLWRRKLKNKSMSPLMTPPPQESTRQVWRSQTPSRCERKGTLRSRQPSLLQALTPQPAPMAVLTMKKCSLAYGQSPINNYRVIIYVLHAWVCTHPTNRCIYIVCTRCCTTSTWCYF